jgi:hypothetical protein
MGLAKGCFEGKPRYEDANSESFFVAPSGVALVRQEARPRAN